MQLAWGGSGPPRTLRVVRRLTLVEAHLETAEWPAPPLFSLSSLYSHQFPLSQGETLWSTPLVVGLTFILESSPRSPQSPFFLAD